MQTAPAATNSEQALLERYTAGTLSADFVQLGGEAQAFLARYLAPLRRPLGPAVLFVPGYGSIIATDPMVEAMLRAFAQAGSAVLVPQLPPAAATATLADHAALAQAALTRVQAALTHLHAQGARVVVVVGADEGAALAARCVADTGGRGLAGFAALGTWDGSLPAIALPVLEVVPAHEPVAMRLAAARRMAAVAVGRGHYQLHQVVGAGRRYPAYADDVAGHVRGWVTRHARAGPVQAGPGMAGR